MLPAQSRDAAAEDIDHADPFHAADGLARNADGEIVPVRAAVVRIGKRRPELIAFLSRAGDARTGLAPALDAGHVEAVYTPEPALLVRS